MHIYVYHEFIAGSSVIPERMYRIWTNCEKLQLSVLVLIGVQQHWPGGAVVVVWWCITTVVVVVWQRITILW